MIRPMDNQAAKRVGMGIVGVGFVGPHHVDLVKRLGLDIGSLFFRDPLLQVEDQVFEYWVYLGE
jgi:hypothetical protein